MGLREGRKAGGGGRKARTRVVVLRSEDAGACVALEIAAFNGPDRFPARIWRRLLGPCQEAGTALAIGVRAPRGVLAAAAIALMRRGGRTARIYSLAVDPGFRGRGLGAALVESIARRTGLGLSLEVRKDNAPARALYERLGFTPGETLRDYYAIGDHGIRYRRADRRPPTANRSR